MLEALQRAKCPETPFLGLMASEVLGIEFATDRAREKKLEGSIFWPGA